MLPFKTWGFGRTGQAIPEDVAEIKRVARNQRTTRMCFRTGLMAYEFPSQAGI